MSRFTSLELSLVKHMLHLPVSPTFFFGGGYIYIKHTQQDMVKCGIEFLKLFTC